jgi:hypothetical protein
MDPDQTTLRVFNEVTAQLAVNDSQAHERAVVRFQALGTGRVELLFRFLFLQGLRRRRRGFGFYLAESAVMASTLSILSNLRHTPHDWLDIVGPITIGLIAVWGSNTFIRLVLMPRQWSRYHKAASMLLDTVNDVDCVPSIIEVLDDRDRNTSTLAAVAFTRLANRMFEADVATLTENHIEIIRRSLTIHRSMHEYAADSRYLCAAIGLLTLRGDAKAEQPVRALLKIAGKNGLPESLVNQANACLQHLQQRDENLQQQRSLLRSSNADVPPVALLRPTNPPSDIHAEELLRQSEPGAIH